MTQSERNTLIFNAAVRDAIERRSVADKALHRLYSIVDDIGADGGYAGPYMDVYLAVASMDDVEGALEDAAREIRHA